MDNLEIIQGNPECQQQKCHQHSHENHHHLLLTQLKNTSNDQNQYVLNL